MQRKIKRLMTAVAGLYLAMSLTACATVTKGTTQQITINTKPTGAECSLEREGTTIAVVNPTPGSTMVEKDKDPIKVTCKKKGYLEGTEMLTSDFQAMTLGNILIGGVIGVGIDALSGAMNQYKPLLAMDLVPSEFISETDRETFFEKLKEQCNLKFDADVARYKSQYENTDDESMRQACSQRIRQAEDSRQEQLAKIEEQRSLAEVRSTMSN